MTGAGRGAVAVVLVQEPDEVGADPSLVSPPKDLSPGQSPLVVVGEALGGDLEQPVSLRGRVRLVGCGPLAGWEFEQVEDELLKDRVDELDSNHRGDLK